MAVHPDIVSGDTVALPSGETGLVWRVRASGLLMVVLPDRNVTVSSGDVELVADLDPDRGLGDLSVTTVKSKVAVIDHAFRFDPNSGLRNSRIDPQPHQVFVASRTLQKLQARMILSDEVGLGKTIEAGLILKSLRVQNLISRVLIITPASLQLQWQSEMRTKFGERFDVMTGERLRMLRSRGVNPWAEASNDIVSINLASKQRTAEELTEVAWDLVIIDEAHKVRKTVRAGKEQVTQAYRMAEGLRDATTGLLLLTATPMQLHEMELYGLIELVEPGLFPTFAAFQRQREQIPKVNEVMRILENWEFAPGRARDAGTAALGKHRELLQAAGVTNVALDEARRADALDRLSDQHPYANVLIRNRKSALGIFSDRRAESVMVQMTPAEFDIYIRVTEYLRAGFIQAQAVENKALGFLLVTYQKMLTSSSNALRKSLRRRATKLQSAASGDRSGDSDPSEDWETTVAGSGPDGDSAAAVLPSIDNEVRLLEELASELDHIEDSKARALKDILDRIHRDDPYAKVVVFTQFIETQNFLRFFLDRWGFRVAIFNGRLRPEEKEAAVVDFRDSASVLVSTESGAEGRNLQFANHLVNYDLPWNPMRIEQRIGRLDRIGQEKPVFIYNLAYADTLEEHVLEVLAERIKLFEDSIGALDPILSGVESEIEELVRTASSAGDENSRLSEYGLTLEERVAGARKLERLMDDLALDRVSFRSSQAQEILGRQAMVDHKALRTVLDEALPLIGGGSIRDHPDVGQVLVLTPKSARDYAKGTGEIHGVFDPEDARRREELPLFTPEHPVIAAILKHVRQMDPGGMGSRTCIMTPAGQYLESVMRIRAHSNGLPSRPRVVLLRVLVPSQEVGVRNASTEVLEGFDFGSRPEALDEVPEWVADASEVIEATADEQYEIFRTRFESEHLQDLAEAREVATRIHGQARARILLDISRETEWIEQNSGSQDPGIQRVMPARQGKLLKSHERLRQQDSKYEQQLEELNRDRQTIEIEELWRGLVTGAQGSV